MIFRVLQLMLLLLEREEDLEKQGVDMYMLAFVYMTPSWLPFYQNISPNPLKGPCSSITISTDCIFPKGL